MQEDEERELAQGRKDASFLNWLCYTHAAEYNIYYREWCKQGKPDLE